MIAKFLYWVLSSYFEQIQADIDYLLMLEGEQ